MNHSKRPIPIALPAIRWAGRRSLLTGLSVLVLGPVLGGGTVGAQWSWRYVQQDLIPQINLELSQSLNRPVQLGAVQQISMGSVRLGASSIPATATDTDVLAIEAIDIRVAPLASLRHRKMRLAVTLIRPQISIEQGADGEWTTTDIQFGEDTLLDVRQVHIQNGTVRIVPHPDFTADARPIVLQRLQGRLRLAEDGKQLRLFLTGRSPDTGQFRLRGSVDLATDLVQMQFWARNVAIAPLARLLPPEIQIQDGQFNADLQVVLPPDQHPDFSGTVTVRELAARAEGEPNPFTHTRGRLRLQGQAIALEDGFIQFGRIPFQVGGSIHLQQGLDLRATVASLSVEDFQKTFNLPLPFAAEGALKTDNLRVVGPFDHAKFSGTVTNATPIRLDRVVLNARTDFVLDKTDDHLSLIGLEVFPEVGGHLAADAEIDLKDEGSDVALNFRAQELPADAIATLYGLALTDLPLGTVDAIATVAVSNDTPQVAMDWHLTGGRYPAQGRLMLRDDTLVLQQGQIQVGAGTVQVDGAYRSEGWQLHLAGAAIPLQEIRPTLPGSLSGELALQGTDLSLATLKGGGAGSVHLPQGHLAATVQMGDRRWQSQITASSIPLQSFVADLPGILQGNVKLGGDLAQLNPQGIQTTGQLQVSQVSPQWRSPIQAAFQWDGLSLQLTQLGTAGLQASGSLTPQLEGWQLVDLGQIHGQFQVQDYDLHQLPLPLPQGLQLAGKVDGNGVITGSPSQPQVSSQWHLRGLAVNQFAFAPRLQGPMQWNRVQGLQISLTGEQDRLTLLAQGDRRQFSMQRGVARAAADWVGDRLQVQVQDWAIAHLLTALPLPEPLSQVQGDLSGTMAVDLSTPQPTAVASLELARPRLGPLDSAQAERHGSDRLTAEIEYRDGALTLPQGHLDFGQSRYQFAGSYQPATEQLTASLSSDRSDLQDGLTALQWVMPSLETTALSLPGFLDSMPLPGLSVSLPGTDLSSLSGQLTGAVTLERSPQTGLALGLDLQGQDWHWGTLGLRQITVLGQHTAANPLTFESLALEGIQLGQGATEAMGRIQFTGSLNPQQMAGDLQVLDVSLPLLGTLLNLPMPLEGGMSAIASLSGNLANPTVEGTLHLKQARASLLEVDEAAVGFSYRDAQFRLNSWSEPGAEQP